MPGHGSKLDRKKEQAIAALLSMPTLPAAAQEVGVAEKTLKRWMREDSFAQEFAKARREFLELALARLQRASGQATTKLMELLDAEDDKLALRAALGILGQAVKGAETMDVLARLEALEAAARQRAAQ